MENLTRLNRISQLQDLLSSAEKGLLHTYLNAFYAPYSSGASIYNQLFQGLELHNKLSEIERILNTKNEDAVRKNLERYEEKLFESLVFPINVNRKHALESLDRDYIRALWYLQVAKRILILGRIDTGLRLLRKVLKIGKRIENFDFILTALYQISSILTYRQITIKSLKVRDEINRYEIARSLFNKAQLLREDIFQYHLINNPSKAQTEELDELYLQSEELLNVAYPTVIRNVLYAQLLYFDKQKEFFKCQEICKKLNFLIESNYAIRKKRERDTITVNLALFSVLELNFSKSKTLLLNLLGDRSISGPTKNFLDIIYARILIYNGEIPEAVSYANECLRKGGFSAAYKPQLRLVLGVANYILKDFKSSIIIFSDIEELKIDKAGWNFFARVFLILSYFKADMYDVSLNELENFKRYLHGKNIQDRQRSIYERVRSIILNTEPKKIVGEWDPTSPEIIDIDSLFRDYS